MQESTNTLPHTDSSLFEVMHHSGLQWLTIQQDKQTGVIALSAGRTWDDEDGHVVRWADYNRTFTLSTPLTRHGFTRGDSETRQLLETHGCSQHLNAILKLITQGNHLGIECLYNRDRNIRFINNVHSDTLGINNRKHAIRAGGIRRHELDEPELDVIIDGLNLSRGMSFKNFAARIPYGGNKMTVMMDPVDLEDRESLGFLAYAIDRSRTFTGPDMGFPPELADELKSHFTLNITGGPNGPVGATGTPTAYGTYLAVREACNIRFGSPSLRGRRIAVQGLGAVGGPLCAHYLQDGASLIVADVDAHRVRALRTQHPEAKIDVVGADAILVEKVDVLSPCALGGIITDALIPRLQCAILMGAANNQLCASSQAEECRLAQRLKEHEILFQVAWWHNLGGVLCGCAEYEHQDEANLDSVNATVREICPEFTQRLISTAVDQQTTPTALAYANAEAAIYPNADRA